jgi:putative transposase
MSYTNLKYHIVFSTKHRRPFLQPGLRPKLTEYIGGIVRDLKGSLLEANGMEDHLHLAAMVHPTCAISTFLREIKGGSSQWVHQTFPDLRDFDWQDDYSAFSVSQSVLPAVLQYIRDQQEHHRKMSFEEELIALLKKHKVDFDPRFLLR